MKLLFSDEFTGDKVNPDNWRFETMRGGLHRAGTPGLDREGFPSSNAAPKRHAMWYDQYHDELVVVSDGKLSLSAKAINEPDPTRNNFNKKITTADGDEISELHPYADYRLYTVWLDTWTRKWVEGVGHTPAGPEHTFKPGSHFKIRISFEQMKVKGLRCSAWTMPVDLNEVENRAYNGIMADGAEIDIFEYDPALPNLLQCKVIGGKTSDGVKRQTVGGSIDARDFDIDLTKGFHIIELIWRDDALIWMLDGKEILRDEINVPTYESYLIISCEGNSGVKSADDLRPGDVLEKLPFMPADAGLYGVSIIKDIEKLPDSRALIDYVRVYQISGKKPNRLIAFIKKILECIGR